MNLLYNLEDKPTAAETAIYSFQWLIFSLTVCAIIPGLVGASLGLNMMEIGTFIQRTFLFCGIFSILQMYLGHKMPIFEGIGGMWYNVLIVLGVMAPQIGMSSAELRSHIVMGMLIVGAVYITLSLFGLLQKVMPVFTPAVKGTFFLLMGLQLSGSIMKGMLGIWPEGEAVNLPGVLIFFGIVALIVWISLKMKGFMQSIGIFIGALIGWLVALILGIAKAPRFGDVLFSLPELWPWGFPTFDLGITVILLIVGFFTLSNLVTSVAALADVVGKEAKERDYSSTTLITGIGNIFAGLFALIGFVPFASSIGYARVTRVASRLPFLIGAILITLLGLFPNIGALFVAIPIQVGYAVVLIMFCQILGVGFLEYGKLQFDNRTAFVVGISLLMGVGTMFIPPSALEMLPLFIRSFAGNGLIVGLIICVLLEQLFLPAGSKAD